MGEKSLLLQVIFGAEETTVIEFTIPTDVSEVEFISAVRAAESDDLEFYDIREPLDFIAERVRGTWTEPRYVATLFR